MKVLALCALSFVGGHVPSALNSLLPARAVDSRAVEWSGKPSNPAQDESVPKQGRAESPADDADDLGAERALLEEAQAALEHSDYAVAREQAALAIDALLARPDPERNEVWLGLLDRAGRTAWNAQDAARAKRAWEQVLEIRSRALPEEHPDLQVARLNLALTLKAFGDLHGARALEEAVLEVRSRTLPEEHPDLQRARANLAATRYFLGDVQGARVLFEAVLEVRSRTLPEEHPDLQAARLNLAVMIKALGDVQGARALEEAVHDIYSRTLPAEHPDLLTVRQNLAVTIKTLGDLHGARSLEEAVLELRSRTLPAEHPDLQASRLNLAVTMKALGDLHGARALEEAVLELRSRTLPAEHPDLLGTQGNLAVTLYSLGDLHGARSLLEAVLEVRSRTLPAEHPDLQAARQNLAVTIKALGDLQGARALEEAVLELFSRTLPAEHPNLQAARQNLAATLFSLGDLQGARALQEEVLELRSRTLPAEHPDLQAARQNLAVTIKALGDLERARSLEEAVLELRSRTLAQDHPLLQSARLNLALTIANQAAWTQRVGESAETGRRERSAELLEAIARSQAGAMRRTILTSSRREAEERAVRLWERLDGALSFLLGYGAFGPMPELLEGSFELSESTRSAALASAALARLAAGSARFAELRAELRERADALAALAQRGAPSRELQDAVARRDALERELLASASAMIGGEPSSVLDAAAISSRLGPDRIAVAYRRFRRWGVDLAGGVEDPELARPVEDSTEWLCAFVLLSEATGARDREERLVLVDLGPLQPIEDAVSALCAALGASEGRGVSIEARDTASDCEERGEALRALVFDPLLAALGDARRIVLVLDDVLHLVPFDALPARRERDGARELLGERYHFELRATLTELLLPSRVAPAGSLVAVGGAAFDREPLGLEAEDELLAAVVSLNNDQRPGLLRGSAWEQGFAPLAHTGLEARGLSELCAKTFGESESFVLEGRRASRESLVELAPRARWLHVATHGWYASESIRSWQDLEPLDKLTGLGIRQSGEEQVRGSSPMLLCGLALAGANLPENALGRAPGLITAEELSTLDLSSCELAVLSACDTNVGERRAGQGVASLQRALQMAGARSVITSLWKVPDEATRELMLDFYRRLWVEKKHKHQALWEAKMRMRDAKDERGNPRHTLRDWAAWVLSGEPD